MREQWTVSFSKSELNEPALDVLTEFEFVEYVESDKNVRIDMSESEFFNFLEEYNNYGFKPLSTDGSNSWCKYV